MKNVREIRWHAVAPVIAALLGLTALVTVAVTSADRDPGVLPPNARPYGVTYTEWAERWFQWALGTPSAENPFGDPDGRFCDVGQSGPVFFLGSNFGGESIRSCRVGAGTPILASPGGYFCLLHFNGETEEELQTCAEDGVSAITNVSLDIDGVAISDLESHLLTTDLFSFTLPADNVLGLPPGEYGAVLAGFFLVIPPLPVGEHVIHMHDELPGVFVSDVTYNLTVGRRE